MEAAQGTASATVSDVALARAVLTAARGVGGVTDISRGHYAIIRTSGLGGDSVEGVQLAHRAEGLWVEVHLVVRPVPLPPLAAAVRAAVAAALAQAGALVTAVDIWIDGLAAPEAGEP